MSTASIEIIARRCRILTLFPSDVSVFPAATSPKAASPLEHASTSAITLSSPPMGSAGVQEPQRADEEKSNSDPLAVERLKLVEQRFSGKNFMYDDLNGNTK
jgi:hypothetical protein